MLDLLLTPAVITSLVIAGCAAFGVSIVARFIPDKRKLDLTMSKAEKALARLRKEIAEKQASMKQLQEELAMLKPLHDRLNVYHEELCDIRVEMERREMLEEEDERHDEEEEDGILGRGTRHRV